MINSITPLILTYNEEENLGRCLDSVRWAADVIVVDSFSTDLTLQIASQYENVRVFQRKFDSHAAQWNFGLSKTCTNWVLSLDADYVVPDALFREIQSLALQNEVVAYYARFTHCVLGQPVRGSLYPPRLILFNKAFCSYVDDGHTQTLRPSGAVGMLTSYLFHDDRKSLGRFLWSQDRYAELEAKKLLSSPFRRLDFADKLRKFIVLMPFFVPAYVLFVKRAVLDGWRGQYYAFQRMLFETVLSLKIIELKLEALKDDTRNAVSERRSRE